MFVIKENDINNNNNKTANTYFPQKVYRVNNIFKEKSEIVYYTYIYIVLFCFLFYVFVWNFFFLYTPAFFVFFYIL